jgi:hypothetical protein
MASVMVSLFNLMYFSEQNNLLRDQIVLQSRQFDLEKQTEWNRILRNVVCSEKHTKCTAEFNRFLRKDAFELMLNKCRDPNIECYKQDVLFDYSEIQMQDIESINDRHDVRGIFCKANFYNSNIYGWVMRGAFQGAKFDYAKLHGVKFHGIADQSTSFLNAVLENVDFSGLENLSKHAFDNACATGETKFPQYFPPEFKLPAPTQPGSCAS